MPTARCAQTARFARAARPAPRAGVDTLRWARDSGLLPVNAEVHLLSIVDGPDRSGAAFASSLLGRLASELGPAGSCNVVTAVHPHANLSTSASVGSAICEVWVLVLGLP